MNRLWTVWFIYLPIEREREHVGKHVRLQPWRFSAADLFDVNNPFNIFFRRGGRLISHDYMKLMSLTHSTIEKTNGKKKTPRRVCGASSWSEAFNCFAEAFFVFLRRFLCNPCLSFFSVLYCSRMGKWQRTWGIDVTCERKALDFTNSKSQ